MYNYTAHIYYTVGTNLSVWGRLSEDIHNPPAFEQHNGKYHVMSKTGQS